MLRFSQLRWYYLLPLLGSSISSALPQSSNFAGDITRCPGYSHISSKQSHDGSVLTAQLSLAGRPCHAFGKDAKDLSLEVSYQTPTRLKVKISDTERNHWSLPDSIWPRPKPTHIPPKDSALQFHISDPTQPFEFWITRSDTDESVFDTRLSSLRPHLDLLKDDDESTAMPSYPLVFEDQYLQIASKVGGSDGTTNFFGFGEVSGGSGFRRYTGDGKGAGGTVQALWTAGPHNPVDQNNYGMHPFYMEHRFDSDSSSGKSHGVFLLNSNGMDVLLREDVVEYRVIGGNLEFYFFAGPDPKSVIEQYVQFIGLPQMQQYWTYGFHLCRWGWNDIATNRAVVQRMKAANIPVDTMWNDLDYMLQYQNFRHDQNRFPLDEYAKYIEELHDNDQHYIPLVDNGIHAVDPNNDTDAYDVYSRGAEMDVFKKNPDGSLFIGKVWPGYTVFPDWLSPNVQEWWTETFSNFSKYVADFDGIWLDMNEPTSFCDNGSCGTGANLSDVDPGIVLPGNEGNLVTNWPEGWNVNKSGTSGNLTVDGVWYFDPNAKASPQDRVRSSAHSLVETTNFQKRPGTAQEAQNLKAKRIIKRGTQTQFISPGKLPGSSHPPSTNLDNPPYSIHNVLATLNTMSVAMNVTNYGGVLEYDIHNLNGFLEQVITNEALRNLWPEKRPFLVSRSSYSGSGKKSAHWLGDNFSTWYSMWTSMQGVLQFQMFGIPMVGADVCGFTDNTDEELCNRWMQLAAFIYPFFRNHNTLGAIDQEPYVWDSVAEASRVAIKIRYSLLPYIYSHMAFASLHGTPAVRALFWEFPNDPSLVGVDRQVFLGDALLITPVLEPNVTSVKGVFPGSPKTIYRDWYTHEKIQVDTSTENKTLSAPLSHINVHIRDGSVILMFSNSGYTTAETRKSPHSLLVSLDSLGKAKGRSYHDDGETLEAPYTIVNFEATENSLSGTSTSPSARVFHITQPLEEITILGLDKRLTSVAINGGEKQFEFDEEAGRLLVVDAGVDLNSDWRLKWE